ncbi:hypothetical protein, variant [Aphanomyces invadans]|uniref:HPP transmembrane region domain-containing protein n=1 Tax=Aphanomyces invadans TaxID=157072 RepID=A0A024UE39_9STRA|nr:hypothetical protein, variant [Aphanomyces invadans]ETW04162.1 hypothetical protein, variant [Aphanomyces invadans]|eukprot:XP_008867118.1 hypothetical protein, variant [Aphanomyces invadans]
MSSGFGTRLVDLSYVQEDAPVDGLRAYLRRIQGVDTTPEPCPAFPPLAILPANRTASNYTAEALAAKAKTLCWSFVACFTGIAILAYIHYNLHATYASGVKVLSITGSFGAMAILVFGAIHAPLAQPRVRPFHSASSFVLLKQPLELHCRQYIECICRSCNRRPLPSRCPWG